MKCPIEGAHMQAQCARVRLAGRECLRSFPAPGTAVRIWFLTIEHMTLQRMEHVGIVVDDLAAATEFFAELGLELQAPANTPGIRHIAFAVEDIDAVVAGLRAHGAELVGELERYEDSYRLCYVRGPEGIIIELAEQIG
jgi:catechol 2,3-dioxygenase-like lactoylglutathione lyase family enzyme